MRKNRIWVLPTISVLFFSMSTAVQANGLSSCDDLAEFGDGNVFTIDFEGIATGPGGAGAVNLSGNEFPGLTFTADSAPGLWVGEPSVGTDNCNTFYGNDFVPVSPDAVFSPDNCYQKASSSPVGSVIINFDDPVEAVGLSFLDAEGATSSIKGYEDLHAGGSELDSAIATGGTDDSQLFRYVSSNPYIQSVKIQLGGGGDGVGMDDLCYVYPDSDDDGIPDQNDLCPDTVADDPTSDKGLGKNRWIWNGEDWETNSNEKGGPGKDFTMEETQGCSCEQILDILVEKTGKSFDGHYKFGCSQSVIEEWIDGWYPLEVVEVPSNVQAGADSQSTLFLGEDYQFIASGVWYNKAGTESIFPVDAEYVSYDNWVSHADGPALGENQLDLQVDTTFQDWGAYSASHDYSLDYAGTGNTANFRVFDGDWTTNTPNSGWYGDNDGSLFVGILLKLW